jgi:hypothetical protein
MVQDIGSLFQKPISWHATKPDSVEFYAYVDGERCELRLNDFPDEPLYTLTFSGQSVSFDDRPRSWSLPMGKGANE